ncbi:hypothetical protein CEP51_004342 [Fusarium floridanum]|uniref:Heterokaryon incompatibility domain-containing protein n=1 Tax=Fusarium floridanum TaxID=1325733 RepID=A0A428S1I2_9HYPO|nr:hypothetical protein CEP51_004342 [Fusarium floridanum]
METETPSTFPYKPLDTEKSEIRMLKLPPKGSENFELITVSLHDDPKYAALSYLWGDPEDQEIITVQGHKAGVRKNLAAALSRLRRGQSSLETDYLWADAICIDQTNHAERSQQVQLMGRIYSSAVVVYSWVGPNDYTLAFKTLATLARLVRERAREKQSSDNATFQLDWLRQHPDLCDAKDEAGGNPWQAVSCLATEKYWKRVWVFQEVALARRLRLLSSGDTILGWDDVKPVSASMTRLMFQISITGRSKPSFISQEAWRFIQDFSPWNVLGLVNTGRVQVQKPLKEQPGYYGWVVAYFAAHLKATDPRDYIYGLLGVTKIPILPDYRTGKPLSELYVEYITTWLDVAYEKNTGPLKPLSFLSVAGVGPFGSSDILPSWVPNYPENALLSYPRPVKSASYSDDDDITRNPTRDPYVVKDTQSLFVWGRTIGPIDTILEELDCNRLQVFYSFLKSFLSRHTHYVSGTPSLQALCQLLLGKKDSKAVSKKTVELALGIAFFALHFDTRDPETTQESPWYHEWETRLYELAFPGVDMQELGFTRTPVQEILSLSKYQRDEILSDLEHALRTYTFFESKSGYLGNASFGAKRGDILCVLERDNFPVLLRKTEGDQYVFVGTVDVLDLHIQGLLHNLAPGAQWFELR